MGWRSLLRGIGTACRRQVAERERSNEDSTKCVRNGGKPVTEGICALNLKMKLHKYTKMCILFI